MNLPLIGFLGIDIKTSFLGTLLFFLFQRTTVCQKQPCRAALKHQARGNNKTKLLKKCLEKLQFWVRNVTGINLENHATLLLSIITVFLQFTITSVLKSNNGWILFYLKKQKETSFNTYEKKELEFQKFAFKIQYQTETKIHTFKWLIKYLN